MPVGFTNFRLWQLSDRAQVSGIRGRVDGDRFNGSLDALYGYAGGRPAGSERATGLDDALLSRGADGFDGQDGAGALLTTLGERGTAMGEAQVRGEAESGAALPEGSAGGTLGHALASDESL